MASIEVPVVVHVDEDEVLRRLKEMGLEPQKHGKWVHHETNEHYWFCNQCGYLEDARRIFLRDCPNCGARMDGDDGPEVMTDDRG